jgi:photosystem II stability/assembly factor-like uncharacterized protein
MSSGKGDLSRLYQTTDGCKTWRLYKQNDEPDGFWDAVAFTASPNLVNSQDSPVLIGDPVRGCLQVFWLVGSKVWWPPRCGKGSMPRVTPLARDGESAFAASNSSALSFERGDYIFGTGGVSGARFFYTREELFPGSNDNAYTVVDSVEVPIGTKTASSGIFSLAERSRSQIVAVGGDYVEPNNSAATAAWSSDKGLHWQAATTPPHGYRSAVAYSPATGGLCVRARARRPTPISIGMRSPCPSSSARTAASASCATTHLQRRTNNL